MLRIRLHGISELISLKKSLLSMAAILFLIFLGDGHWIYFIYTSVNYSEEVFLDGAS